MVLTLIVWARSPPVPTTSITGPSVSMSTRVEASSMASTMPPSSATVSPFIRRATMKAAIWAGLAAPSRISVIVTRAVSASRSPPSKRVPRIDGPPAVRGEALVSHRREPTAGGSGGPPALPEDAAALLLGGPAPHAFLLPALERELQAGLAHRADLHTTLAAAASSSVAG